ncbi:MAG: hypothetical protein PSN34_13055 [Urechidicola sp.]|nr:hypothetical protein [Urechidicola sp.]
MENYIISFTTWLLGKDDLSILSQQSGSVWETSLNIITLNEIYNINNIEESLKKEIKRKSIATVDWILSKKNDINSNFTQWDNVTWDTAVAIQSLLMCLSEYSDDLSQKQKDNIKDATFKGCLWLYSKFSQWELNTKYPFGDADISRIIGVLLKCYNTDADLYNKIKTHYKENIDPSDDGKWLNNIVMHLLYKGADKLDTGSDLSIINKNTKYNWGDNDYFTTSDIVDSFCIFYKNFSNNNIPESFDKNIIKYMEVAIKQSCIKFENNQVDGMWGSHIDTIRVVGSYLLAGSLVSIHTKKKIIKPEIHTIFKAIRWMCDEKQRFDDGSFMHTMFLTVFFADTLVTVYKYWNEADKKILDVYDDVVWSSPARTTPERLERLSLEIEYNQLVGANLKLVHSHNLTKIISGVTISVLFVSTAILLLGLFSNYVTLDQKIVIGDWVSIFIGTSVALGTAVSFVIKKFFNN